MIESEKTIERYLNREIKGLGGWSLKLPAVHISGIPDRICLLPGGRVFFAEIKTTGKELRKIQIHVAKKLKKLGFRVEVIDSTEQVRNLISEYAK